MGVSPVKVGLKIVKLFRLRRSLMVMYRWSFGKESHRECCCNHGGLQHRIVLSEVGQIEEKSNASNDEEIGLLPSGWEMYNWELVSYRIIESRFPGDGIGRKDANAHCLTPAKLVYAKLLLRQSIDNPCSNYFRVSCRRFIRL